MVKMSIEKLDLTNSKGSKISTVLSDLGKDFIVLLCHGYPSNKQREKYINLEKVLNTVSISTLRFDFSGQGESGGEFSEFNLSQGIDDLQSVISSIIDKGFQNIGLWGNSFGGSVAIQVTPKFPEINSLCLTAPVIDWKDQKSKTKTKEEMNAWKENGFIRIKQREESKTLDIPYSFYQDSIQYNGYKAFSEIQVPILIIHGNRDEKVPISLSKKAEELNSNAKLVILEGANHHFSDKKHLDLLMGFSTEFFLRNKLY
ncbi:alpha/beta fold hydrolase [Candidatus Dojkabacteria bacterium]|nr:alpha/beta fold hydrolase [Candidatus Dojkabacteria bacterium]